MNYFGNEIWNKAVDNKNKLIIPMREEAFENFQKILETAGLNYYAFGKNGAVKMAINKKDINYFKRLIGMPLADKINIVGAAKEYTPPTKNIFGNTRYRYIPQKSYCSGEKDVILKLAEKLLENNIPFSGYVYTKKATITVCEKDIETIKSLYNAIIIQREHHNITKKKDYEIQETVPYNNIQDKVNIMYPNITSKNFKKVKPFIDAQSIEYSSLVRNKGIIFTISKTEAFSFNAKLQKAVNISSINDELDRQGFTIGQKELMIETIVFCAEHDAPLTQVKPEYTDNQLLEICNLVKQIYSQSELERLEDKQGYFTRLLNLKSQFDYQIILKEITTERNYTDEQKSILLTAVQAGMSAETLADFDESYSEKELQNVIAAYKDFDFDKINAIVKQHNNSLHINGATVDELHPDDVRLISDTLEPDLDMDDIDEKFFYHPAHETFRADAISAQKDKPEKERTYYFEVAKLRKTATNISKKDNAVQKEKNNLKDAPSKKMDNPQI